MMRHIKSFESSDFGDEKIQEISDFVGNVFDILLPHHEDGECEYTMQLWIKKLTYGKSEDLHIYFEPDDIYEDLESYIKEYRPEIFQDYDKIAYSLEIDFVNVNQDFLDKIGRRLKSEYSPEGGGIQNYSVEILEIRPWIGQWSITIYDPIFIKEVLQN